MNKVNVIPVNVYRNACDLLSMKNVDTTNGGISARFNTLYMINPYGTQELDEDDERLLSLVGDAGNSGGFHLEPVNGHKGRDYTDWEYGGNIGEVRIHGKTNYLRIHDRQDTWEDYEVLSR